MGSVKAPGCPLFLNTYGGLKAAIEVTVYCDLIVYVTNGLALVIHSTSTVKYRKL